MAFVPRRAKPPAPRLIDPRNRVALSKDILRALDVAAGDYVTFVLAPDGTVYVRKLLLTIAPAPVPGSAPSSQPG